MSGCFQTVFILSAMLVVYGFAYNVVADSGTYMSVDATTPRVHLLSQQEPLEDDVPKKVLASWSSLSSRKLTITDVPNALRKRNSLSSEKLLKFWHGSNEGYTLSRNCRLTAIPAQSVTLI